MPTIIRASSQVPKAAPVRKDDDSATESDSEADVTVSNIQASQAGRESPLFTLLSNHSSTSLKAA